MKMLLLLHTIVFSMAAQAHPGGHYPQGDQIDSWDASNKYTYTLVDTDGNSVKTTYQR